MPDNEFTQRRLNFIDNAERNLISGVSGIDVELWKHVRNLTEKIRTEEKRITSSAANYSLLGELNKIGREIQAGPKRDLIKQIVDDLINQGDLVKMYFNKFLELERAGIQRKVHKELLYRIGYDGKGFVDRGVLFDLYNDDSPIRQVKAMTVKAIASGKAFKEFVDDMEGFVLGDENKLGVTSAHLLTATRDVFAQNDRSLTKQYADELGLDKFIFSGGLMRTTRDFCRQRNGKIFTRKEIESWKDLDFDGKPAGYSPFYDVGGYNCRHVLDPISDEVAQELQNEAGGDPVVVPPGPVKPEPVPAPEQIHKEREENKKPAPAKSPAKKTKAATEPTESTETLTPKQLEKQHGIKRVKGKIDPATIAGNNMDVVEGVIREQKFESGAVFSRDGKQLYFKNGKKSKVEWYDFETKFWKNAIVTHNHPSGGSFSYADINCLTRYDLGLYEMRAVGKEYTYSLKNGSTQLTPQRLRDLKAFHAETYEDLTPKYRERMKELAKKPMSLMEMVEKKMTNEEIRNHRKEVERYNDDVLKELNRELTHEAITIIADEFGLEYKRTKR